MKIQLTSTFGSRQEFELHERDFPAVIGRGKFADIKLEDHWVSRVHCVLDLIEERLFVRDLDSRHGIFVNQQSVEKAELSNGDRLDVGLTTLVVELRHVDSCVI